MNFSKAVMLSLLLITSSASADKASHRKAANELIEVAKVHKLIDQMYSYVERGIKISMARMNVPKELEPVTAKYSKKMIDMLKQELVWEKLKEKYVDIYVEVYSEDELKGLVKFYKTPLGQKLLVKMPEVMKKSLTLGQSQMNIIMPKIRVISQEMVAELQKEKKKLDEKKKTETPKKDSTKAKEPANKK